MIKSVPTELISMKFDIFVFDENPSRKLKLHSDITTITGTLHADQYTIFIIFRSVIIRMGTFSVIFI